MKKDQHKWVDPESMRILLDKVCGEGFVEQLIYETHTLIAARKSRFRERWRKLKLCQNSSRSSRVQS